MKKSLMLFFKSFVISLICLCLVVGAVYWYVENNVVPTDNTVEKVPYAQQKPDNAGVLLEIGGEKSFFYLDFQNTTIVSSITPQISGQEVYGYPLDYKITADYELLSFIIDYFGGIELTINEESLRYTGIQISETLKRTNDKQLRREIIKSVCKKTSERGVDTEFFVEIIQNSNTNMRLVDCYFWYEDLDAMCKIVEFID